MKAIESLKYLSQIPHRLPSPTTITMVSDNWVKGQDFHTHSMVKSLPPRYHWWPCKDHGLPCSSNGKESACDAGDLVLIPGLGKSPRGGNGYTFQYSGLENSMDCYSPWGCI